MGTKTKKSEKSEKMFASKVVPLENDSQNHWQNADLDQVYKMFDPAELEIRWGTEDKS